MSSSMRTRIRPATATYGTRVPVMTGIPLWVFGVDGQVLTWLEQVRDDDARAHAERLDYLAHDDKDLALAGQSYQIDGLFLGDEPDVAGPVGDEPVGSQMLGLAQRVQGADGGADLLQGSIFAEAHEGTEREQVTEGVEAAGAAAISGASRAPVRLLRQ